ncbi:SLOG family protein [Enterococcus saccharolyticus]|uniref:SLOG family protein n=1 Tax=Enterococcus saccharolyticus TaxID=41997 RepID=UPI0039E0AD83
MQTMVISGYRSFELGVFQEKDPKIKVIKKVLKITIQQYIEEGLEWILIGGNLGTEIWAGQVVLDLQKEYPELKLGVIFPFEDFGENWNEKNQQVLTELKIKANYVNAVSHVPYKNPGQLKNHSQFLLTHSGGLLVVYDDEYPGKTQFLLKEAQEHASKNDFIIHQITMDDLQNTFFEDDSV